jgi:hypothetical protein
MFEFTRAVLADFLRVKSFYRIKGSTCTILLLGMGSATRYCWTWPAAAAAAAAALVDAI